MIIVIEGQDRCGKDTVINIIKQHLFNYKFQELKYTKIDSIYNHPDYQNYQKLLYQKAVDLVKLAAESDIDLILNRSWYSEYVYGIIYRNYNAKYVFDYEKKLKSLPEPLWKKLFLIILVDSEVNLIKREDGNSLTTDNNNRLFNLEKFYFKKVIKYSNFCKSNILYLDESMFSGITPVIDTVKTFLTTNIRKDNYDQ